MSFVGSLLWKVRQKYGHGYIIWPGAVVVFENAQGEFLMGKRADNGHWAFIQGLMEEGESVEDTARREAEEEVGIKAGKLTCFAISSSPKKCVTTFESGDVLHPVGVMFHCTEWAGEPALQDDEHTDLKFLSVAEIEKLGSPFNQTILKKYLEFSKTGKFQVY